MKNLKIGTRLGIGFAAILALLAVIVGIGIFLLSTLNDHVVQLSDNDTPALLNANQWATAMDQAERRTRFILTLYDTVKIKQEADGILKLKAQREHHVEQLQQTIRTIEGKATLRQVVEANNAYTPLEAQFLKLAIAEDMVNAKKLLADKLGPAQLAYAMALDKLIDFQTRQVKQASASARGDYLSGRNAMIGLLAGALLIGIAYAVAITRSITGPVSEALRIAQTVAAGDLTSRIEVVGNDEMGQLLKALKYMNTALVNIVSEVRGGTDSIAAGSQQIASGNAELSHRTEEQASSLEETASSMEQMTATVKQNADNAHQANILAVEASEVAARGGTVVSGVVGTMGEINASAKRIADIVGVIDGIAFQTNILALNAAVEAARAGEQGRGFAVVASEVRNLAQRSAAAAKEIKALIDDSMEKVDAGGRLVDHAGATMREVVESISRVTLIMAEISTASQEQRTGIEQINRAITQMDDVTQHNAALVEQSAAASQEMREQAKKLAQVVAVFNLDGAPDASNHALLATARTPAPLALR